MSSIIYSKKNYILLKTINTKPIELKETTFESRNVELKNLTTN